MKKVLSLFCLFCFFVPLFGQDASKLYRQCKGCHGKYGNHPAYERQSGVLAGRTQAELSVIMKAIRDGDYKTGRVNKIMKKSIQDFDDKDIEVLAEYISKFKKEKTE